MQIETDRPSLLGIVAGLCAIIGAMLPWLDHWLVSATGLSSKYGYFSAVLGAVVAGGPFVDLERDAALYALGGMGIVVVAGAGTFGIMNDGWGIADLGGGLILTYVAGLLAIVAGGVVYAGD